MTEPDYTIEPKQRPAFHALDSCQRLLASKAHDYEKTNDFHSNFKFANTVSQDFPDMYKSYTTLIGVKLARLSNLLSTTSVPQHESIEDSFLDLISYCLLMYERYMHESANNKYPASLERP